jgi:ATP-dependent DNA ligase
LWFNGKDIRSLELRARRVFLEKAVKEWGNSYVAIVGQETGTLKHSYYDLVVRSGGEGVVLKRLDHKYGDEKLWVKVKAEDTADVVILGFQGGKGKYTGKAGAILFGQYRKKGAVLDMDGMGSCRGYTDSQMDLFTLRPKSYIGQVIEIAHNGREPTGAFRHPRFSRFRPDKDPKDCVYREGET